VVRIALHTSVRADRIDDYSASGADADLPVVWEL
jgi:hypothetical protein